MAADPKLREEWKLRTKAAVDEVLRQMRAEYEAELAAGVAKVDADDRFADRADGINDAIDCPTQCYIEFRQCVNTGGTDCQQTYDECLEGCV